MRKKFTPPYSLKAFTLSEVLITLVIIGVIAAITVPAVLNSLQNQEFKVGYKKAFSDLSQAAAEGVAFGEFPYRNLKWDYNATKEEWNILKNKFGVLKVCEDNNVFDCWVDADRVCNGACSGVGGDEEKGYPIKSNSGFIDISGRAWVLFSNNENIFMVDTNGDKAPNRFGKDRFSFTFAGENGRRICSYMINSTTCNNPGIPLRVIPYIQEDVTTESSWCHYPTCNYKSWLLN